jgi:hypothetical protein
MIDIDFYCTIDCQNSLFFLSLKPFLCLTNWGFISTRFAPSFVNYKKGCTRLAAASDKVYQLLAHGRWFSPGTPVSYTTKTGHHDIAEILLKVALKHQKSNQSIISTNDTYWLLPGHLDLFYDCVSIIVLKISTFTLKDAFFIAFMFGDNSISSSSAVMYAYYVFSLNDQDNIWINRFIFGNFIFDKILVYFSFHILKLFSFL